MFGLLNLIMYVLLLLQTDNLEEGGLIMKLDLFVLIEQPWEC